VWKAAGEEEQQASPCRPCIVACEGRQFAGDCSEHRVNTVTTTRSHFSQRFTVGCTSDKGGRWGEECLEDVLYHEMLLVRLPIRPSSGMASAVPTERRQAGQNHRGSFGTRSRGGCRQKVWPTPSRSHRRSAALPRCQASCRQSRQTWRWVGECACWGGAAGASGWGALASGLPAPTGLCLFSCNVDTPRVDGPTRHAPSWCWQVCSMSRCSACSQQCSLIQ
jgi:hypothetical protein